MRSLLELERVHEELHEVFARHRDHVVGLEFEPALRTLEEYAALLDRHIEDEERLLIPLFSQRVGAPTGGSPEMFLLEHRNIRRNLDALLKSARALAERTDAGRRQAHEFLAEETMLMHLVEHHERREHAILYPELDRTLSVEERERILLECRR